MKSFKQWAYAAALALPLMAAVTPASAAWPEQSVRWIVPYAAGGGSDFLARTVSGGMSGLINQSIVVENKPGGNTAIGASDVSRAKPDGYTMMSADNGTLVFNPALYSSLSYDPEKNLTPVTLMGRFPMILVADPKAGLNSVADVIKKGKEDVGINFGSAGAGSPHHLAMELFKSDQGLNMTHIPYRGAAPSLTDVAGGQVPIMMVDLAAGAGFINTGKVKPLAVANNERLPQLPDVPTFAELGFPNVVAAAEVGVVTTAGTPKETVMAMNEKIVQALKDPKVNKSLVDFGIQPVGNTPDEYAALLKQETVRWQKLIKDLGIKLD